MQILITKIMDNKKKRCVTNDLDSRILKFTIEFDLV